MSLLNWLNLNLELTMNNVVCLKHRTYDGATNPDLSCKTCCTKYIAHIKSGLAKKTAGQLEKAPFNAEGWLEKKTAVQAVQQQKLSINPSFI